MLTVDDKQIIIFSLLGIQLNFGKECFYALGDSAGQKSTGGY